jgi:NADPH-dependent 2,4-dienoyl-CoA reductase/sulfur reductase-like enzyme
MAATVAIVGSSIAGVRTAQALRAQGHRGTIVLVGAETELPYDKPPLSKQFLAGEWDAERVRLLTAEQARAAGIELRLGAAAVELDAGAQRLALADGGQLGYDALVIATGAAARPSPWVAESGVHVLRTLADSRALRAALADEGPVAVIGGGFIGAEVAATAHTAGRPVTVVDPLAAPIERVLGAELGAVCSQIHDRHGVEARFGVGVRGVQGRAGNLEVQLTDGRTLSAATVVVGIGAVPNVDWLRSSGIELDDGVVCDGECRAVGQAGVYAVGDVARWWHAGHGERVRVEHWTNACEQAACVAHNIVAPESPRSYRPTEYVWSDQYDWRIQIAGRPARSVAHELIGDPDAPVPRFAAVYGDERGRVVAAAAVNWPRALVVCRRLIGEGAGFGAAVTSVAELAAVARAA